MCDRCLQVDDKIAHYRRISQYVTDQFTRDRLEKLFDEMRAEKLALHPEQGKQDQLM
jgi:hypothetical protein